MRLIVGLGNPGHKYHGTRHNVGFAVVDGFAQSAGSPRFQKRFSAEVAEVREGEEKVLLLKPQTFMNLCGRSVREAIDFYQVELQDVLVVCDDINLPLGKLRFRARGTHGGHNGLRDVQNHLGTNEYPRLRVGVDAPDEDDCIDHVLGKFRPSEKPVIEEALATAVQAVGLWCRAGIQECMNEYNG